MARPSRRKKHIHSANATAPKQHPTERIKEKFEFQKWRDDFSKRLVHEYALPLARFIEDKLVQLERQL